MNHDLRVLMTAAAVVEGAPLLLVRRHAAAGLAPTVGLALTNAANGIAGTLMAAAFSLFMYLAFPDGCSNAEAHAPCYFFGVLAGAASFTCCLLLDLGRSFQVFYCAA